jgi:hypothetical protein
VELQMGELLQHLLAGKPLASATAACAADDNAAVPSIPKPPAEQAAEQDSVDLT